MGSLQSVSADQYEGGNSEELIMPIDFKKPIRLELQPLSNWSLKQIREIYSPFKQRKGSPLLTRSEFLRFLRLSRIMSFHLFDKMCTKHNLNIFEIVSILVLMAYTNYTYKVQFLFHVFDLDCSRGLQFKELILSFKSLIRGFSILTDQPVPRDGLLEKYAQVMFSRADLNNDQCLQLGDWFESNTEGIFLFKRFEPELIGKEDYYIFNSFNPPLSEVEIKLTYERIKKEYMKIPLLDRDFLPLDSKSTLLQSINFKSSDSDRLDISENSDSRFKLRRANKSKQIERNPSKKVAFAINSTKRLSKQQRASLTSRTSQKGKIYQELKKLNFTALKDEHNKQNSEQNSIKCIEQKESKINFGKTEALPTLKKTTSTFLKLNSTREYQNSKKSVKRLKEVGGMAESARINKGLNNLHTTALNSCATTFANLNEAQIHDIKSKHMRKKFNNMIILKGRTITKKEIFDLKEYFQSMSAGKKAIHIENFLDAFNEEKYSHMKSVAASLFNFLDKNQDGKVTFKEFIAKLYPDLSAANIEVIKVWINEYNQNFNLQKSIKANREHEELKKRILPSTCVPRFEEMFCFFDKDKKGYIDLNDLRRVLGEVSTQTEIKQTFKDNDLDGDGKLNLKEFLHVLLPIDLEIQGI